LLGLLLAAAPAQAAIDVWNMLAPGSTGDDQFEFVVVRRPSTGNIHLATTTPLNFVWTDLGVPTGGVGTSGPQIAYFINGFTGAKTLYVVVRGSDGNIWEKHKTGSAAWTGWSNTKFGMPPGGTTSAVTAAWHPMGGMVIAVRGANNIPFVRWIFRQPSSPGEGMSVWTQAGTEAIFSAPAVARSSFSTQLFALNSSKALRVSTCAAPVCFPSWVNKGGVLESSPHAVFWDGEGSGIQYTTVVGTGTDTATWSLQHSSTAGWGGWTSRFGASDAAPSLALNNSNRPAAFQHRSDGNWYWQNVGNTWTNIGHP
jgi:hypothetical protein